MLTEQTQITTERENDLHYPQYKDNSISNIPDLLQDIFNIQNKTLQKNQTTQNSYPEQNIKTILLVVDGFGYNQYLKHIKENPFLTKLTTKGVVEPLTSVFPSQTTNALTTLNTGLTPQEHGLFEYFIYLKNIGIVNALRFECIDHKNKQLNNENLNKLLIKGETIHNRLKANGIKTFTHINATNATNACSKLIFQGSTIVPATKTSDMIVQLRKKLENSDGNAYFFVHIDTLDTIAHEYGPNSYEYSAELALITYLLNKELVQKINPKTAQETLLLLTADHGEIAVNPKETIYLPKTALHLQTAENHKPIPPTGSPREIFLHIKTEKLTQTKDWLTQKIGNKAQIIETKKAAEKRLFGLGTASEEFFERTGNLMILPYGHETIWFENPEGRKIPYLGQHGGLNKQEMLVPFAVANLANLKEKTPS